MGDTVAVVVVPFGLAVFDLVVLLGTGVSYERATAHATAIFFAAHVIWFVGTFVGYILYYYVSKSTPPPPVLNVPVKIQTAVPAMQTPQPAATAMRPARVFRTPAQHLREFTRGFSEELARRPTPKNR